MNGRPTWRPEAFQVHTGLAGVPEALRRYRSRFVASVAFGVIQQGALGGAAALAAMAVGRATTGKGPIGPLVVAISGLIGLRAAADWMEAWLSHDVAYRLLADLRVGMFDAFARLAPGKLTWERSGDLAERAMADTEQLEHVYAHVALYACVAALLTPTALVLLALVHPLLVFAALPFLTIALLVPLIIREKNLVRGSALRAARTELTAELVDATRAARDIVGFGAEELTSDRLARSAASADALERRYQRWVTAEQGVATAAALAAGLATLFLAARLVSSGRVDASELPLATVLASAAAGPILALLGSTKHLGTSMASATRIAAVMSARPAVTDGGNTQLPDGPLPLTFQDVVFAYPGTPAHALRSVSLTVHPGEFVALVGPSGAGKTTLAQLALRYADPDAGAVRLGGIDVRRVTLPELRGVVALVPQEVIAFRRTIRQNLLIGGNDPGDEVLRAALREVRLLDRLGRLPDGLDSTLGTESAVLSGGERQRLALARALLRGARVLVLDEVSSMLDAESERRLIDALRRTSEGRTTLVVAHRLPMILAADRIVVLAEGEVADHGKHHELLERCDVYRRLIIPQMDSLGT